MSQVGAEDDCGQGREGKRCGEISWCVGCYPVRGIYSGAWDTHRDGKEDMGEKLQGTGRYLVRGIYSGAWDTHRDGKKAGLMSFFHILILTSVYSLDQ
jgi:hypothetical protein